MLTTEQEKWLSHLSNESKIKIVPFDPTSQKKFEKIKVLVQSKLGETIQVEHHGASSLGISGQDEIDVYIPVPPMLFDNYVIKLTELFGKPRSQYPLERARFVTSEGEKHVDVFLVNDKHINWRNCLKFEKYLKANPDVLEEYRLLKESGNGLGTRDYYQKKNEFINVILARTTIV